MPVFEPPYGVQVPAFNYRICQLVSTCGNASQYVLDMDWHEQLVWLEVNVGYFHRQILALNFHFI